MRRYVFRLAILSLAVLGPSVVRGDDQQIAQQIVSKLQAEKKAGALKGFSIDLQVDEGTVWLSGRVANPDQQAKALDIARRIPGVVQVVNDLTIAAPPAKTAAKPVPAMPATQPVMESDPAPAAKPIVIHPQVQVAPKSSTAASMPAPRMAQQAEPTMVEAEPMPVNEPMPAQPERLRSEPRGILAKAFKITRKSEQPEDVQPASASQDFAAGPIGSGVDPNAGSSRRNSVVQAAQPVANLPQAAAMPMNAMPMNGMPMNAMPVPYMAAVPVYAGTQSQVPLPFAPARPVNYAGPVEGMGAGGMPGGAMPGAGMPGTPMPMHLPGSGVGIAPARYDHPSMPGYAWPSYAAYPNYAAVTYPKQYSASAWPYIGPFYPYPQVPLGWRKVTMEWDDGWWMLDFKDRRTMYNH
jgi:hypothetical protein